ncbi:AsmA family protein [Pseudohongiella sp. O18]|uniref:AsmA family protein n=1 Tax=Pseudohongiella sp. O18 TaxID=2904248 RepID=UPI001F1EA8BD|nr:AsmA family protein [Pseudohongiella sp. O18]
MSKLLKYLTFFITGLLVFVVALALILFVVIDPNRYRPVLEDLVASQTGLQLQIAGDMNWTFRPVFGLSLQDVRLSNGVTPQELASFSNVALRLEPAGLFRGELNLQEFIAEDLHINWTVDSNGQTNWLLDLPPSEAPAQTSSAGSIPVDINIAQVTLNNASIDIQDQQQGLNASLRRLNLSGSNTNLQGQQFPLEISTQLIDQTTNRRLDLNLQSDTSIDLDAGDIALSDIRFNLSPLLITGSAEINNFRNDLSWQADLSSQPFNLSYLLENFMALPEDSMPAPDEQQITVQTLRVNGDTEGVTLQELLLGLNDTSVELTGDLLFATGNRRMMIGYELRGGDINLDDWLPASEQGQVSAPGSGTSGGTSTANATELPLEILNTLDLRGNHSFDSISYSGLRLAPVSATLQIQNGVLNLVSQPAGFYDGTLAATASVNASSRPARVEIETQLENVSAAALTEDKPRLGFFTGNFNANTSHTMQGNTVDALLNSISGASQMQVANSSVDITMLKQVFAAISVLNPDGNLAAQWADTVRFNNVEAYLLFNDGLDENQELRVRLDNFDVSGTGGINLDQGEFDYSVEFTILGEPAPQTIRVNPNYHNIPWPIRCDAAFADPGLQYCSPDLQRVREVFAQMARNEVERRASEAIGEQVERLRNRVRELFQNN